MEDNSRNEFGSVDEVATLTYYGSLQSPTSANGLRHRGRHRAACDSDLSRLEGRINAEEQAGPSSLMGVLPGHQSRHQARIDNMQESSSWPSILGSWASDDDGWEESPTSESSLGGMAYTQERRHAFHAAMEGGREQFHVHPLISPRRNYQEPSWQQFMQDMLQNFLGRGRRMVVMEAALDYTSDPGNYLDDPRGFERLLSELADNDNTDHGPPPAAKSAIETLPTIIVKQKHIEDDSASCPVCKELMEVGHEAKEFPCQHLYHEACIMPWLNFRNTCPVCRFELPTDDADYEARKLAVANHPHATAQVRGGGNGSRVLAPQGEVETSLRFHGGSAEEIEEERDGSHSIDERSRGWLLLAARPLLSIMGLVLVLTIGNRLIRGRLPSSRQHYPTNP